MKHLIAFTLIVLAFYSCQKQIEPSDDLVCTPEGFVGTWDYILEAPYTVDTLPDIIIEFSNDPDFDLKINEAYYNVRKSGTCSTSGSNVIIDTKYELISNDVIVEKTSTLIFFGTSRKYKRK